MNDVACDIIQLYTVLLNAMMNYLGFIIAFPRHFKIRGSYKRFNCSRLLSSRKSSHSIESLGHLQLAMTLCKENKEWCNCIFRLRS